MIKSIVLELMYLVIFQHWVQTTAKDTSFYIFRENEMQKITILSKIVTHDTVSVSVKIISV